MNDTNATMIERYIALAEITKTLGHEHRLLLLDHVAQGERSVERLSELSGLSVANASQHLQQLRRAGLVQTKRDGKRVLYRLGDGPVLDVIAELRRFAEFTQKTRTQVIEDSLERPEYLQAVSREELVRMIKEDSVIVLDVRPNEEFALGHLPHARNIPVEELAERLDELDPERPVVAYCRGPYCVMSLQASELLHKKGFTVKRFEAGLPEWKSMGLPIY